MKLFYHKMLVLVMVLAVQFAFAQNPITGKVTNSAGEPLLGVNISKKGTNIGTQSNFDGEYTIRATDGEVLVFGYLGLKSQEIIVAGQSVINVTMEEDAQALGPVVVTALGVSREKKSLGYATQTVTGEEITETRNQNALNSLSGKVAGVQVSNSTGALGGSTRILIRGASSITQENRPLIVVDGIPLDNSNYNTTGAQTGGGGRDYGDAGFDINPDDIATLNVLKGGAAAALYGSRGINGVILITTKSGKAGKSSITINSGVTFDEVNILPKVQKLYGGGAGNPQTIGQTDFGQSTINGTTYDVVAYGVDESWGPRYDPNRLVLHWDAFDPEFAEDFLQPRAWINPKNGKDDFWETGVQFNNSVAFASGTEKSTYRLSLNNTQTEGIVPNTNLRKTSINLNATSQLTDKFKINSTVNLTVTDGFNRPGFGYTGEGVVQQLYQFGQTSLDYERLKKYKKADGSQRSWNRVSATNGDALYSDNPYWTLYENTASDKRTRWYGTIGGQYNFTDELYAVANVFADTYSFAVNSQRAVGSVDQAFYLEQNRTFQEVNYEGRLHYDKTFLDNKLSLNAFVGGNKRVNEFHRLSASTSGGLVVPGLYTITNSAAPASVTEFDSDRQVNSLYASASFGYDNTYYLNFTGRNDWSSTLPADNNSFFYPSVNGSVVFSNFIDAPWLTFGKLRGGYSEVGSDTDPYQLKNYFGAQIPFLGDVPFSQGGGNNNAELGPETKISSEIGVELGFLKNRLKLDMTYYSEKTEDLITPVTVDPATGFSSTFVNAGSLRNRGLEIFLSGKLVQTEDFSWDLSVNFNKNNSEVLSLIDDVESLEIARFPFNGVTLNAVVGEPYGVIRGTNYVFDDQGNRVINANGSYAETRNVENLGSILPDYNMGIRNSFNYKGFSLGALIDIQKGGKYRSLTNIWGNYSGILEQTAANNIREEGIVLPGVTGTVAYDVNGNYTVTNTAPNTQVIPAQQYGQDFYNGNDAQNVFDADYVKLREITLGYSIPKKYTEGFGEISITAFARNLFVWGLDNENFDPEVATAGSGNIQGSEGGSLPSTRSYGMNLQLKF
ncbi:SusC/RagA family TonB-linked outer membrane protein [Nonlabens antarcticus]|uniref:SusC/RagA family TonB-linked outer membrane protein n=1 Tax=Nonlabens antarcticus TaxID=392714 RepID=UPI001891F074|nr:SusC/RagA family TonB-linked outer membrane protein [Nonlabens antarcticus]